jgi:Ca2+-binding RTX toxin-like protein
MATPNETLRFDIQKAAPTDIISLNPADSPFSVGTLAKIECAIPIEGGAGYTIDGNGSNINDTRIYQNNIDGPAPGTVTNLTLNYTTAAANTNAILRATQGTYNIGMNVSDPNGTGPVKITGNHSGWAGNSGVYMSLNSQTPNNTSTPPSTAQLNLSYVTVDVKGQAGFDPAKPDSGTAFLQSWNNSAGVNMENTTFDEAGFRNSFHFATFSPSSTAPTTLLGEYNFNDVTFTRSANATVRKRGNVLESVKATFSGTNTFENGSFLDLSGNVSQVTFAQGSQNDFKNIPADGYGIRISQTSPSGQTLSGTAVTSGAMFDFTGPGLPLKYVNSANGAFTSLPAGIGTQYSINGANFSSLYAGGQGNDTISGDGLANWINGDTGNDSIDSGSGNDFVLGGDGNDTIIGGLGNDTTNGGAGIDTISYAGTGSAVTVNLATGIATGQGNDVFSNFENIVGTTTIATQPGDNLTGDSNANSIDGAGGNDIINGGAGNDTIIGGTGLDTLTGGSGNDLFRWVINSGTDTITDFNSTDDQFALTDIFAGTTGPATLNASDYLTNTSIASMSSGNNKVREITNSQTTTQIMNNTAAVTNTYALVFNSTLGYAQLVFDTNWADTANRQVCADLPSINSLALTTAFSNTNFFAV